MPPARLDGSDPDWPIPKLKALSYSIGVLLKGDGFVCVTRKTDYSGGSLKVYRAYKIGLRNKSIGFINAFNAAFAGVLERKPVHLAKRNKEGHFQVQYCSKEFVSWWLDQRFFGLRKIIEAFPCEYLKGRYDSDCNVYGCKVSLIGVESQRPLMEFERKLCLKLGMRAGRIRPHGKPGDVSYIGPKRIVKKEQGIRFTVNARDFLRCVGVLNVEWRDYRLKHFYKGRRWTPWPSAVRERAMTLRGEHGWECKRIAEELRREYGREAPPYTTVYFWLKRRTKSWEEHARMRA